MQNGNRPLRIFLCYSSADKLAVRELYQRLKADGFEPWLDKENLLPGQDWQLEIPKAVKGSDVVLVCLSRKSTTTAGYFHKEIRLALDVADLQPEGSIYIIPLKLKECDVTERLAHWQWVDYFSKNGYDKLLRALHTRAESLGIKPTQKRQGPSRQDWLRGGLITLLAIVAVAAIIGAIISGNNGTSVSSTQTTAPSAAVPSIALSPSATLTSTLAPTFMHMPTSAPASAQISPATLLPTPTIGAMSTLVPVHPAPAAPAPELTSSPTLETISTRVSGKDRMTIIYVPAGEFTMGSNISENESPEHKVYLDAFWIDQTEVTNAMFGKFVDATNYRTNAEMDGWASVFNSSASVTVAQPEARSKKWLWF